MTGQKIQKVGNSAGVILPREILARLHAEVGDVVHLSEVPGGILISLYDEEFAEQLQVAEAVMRRRRNALRELAE